jgi:hypothetical protein
MMVPNISAICVYTLKSLVNEASVTIREIIVNDQLVDFFIKSPSDDGRRIQCLQDIIARPFSDQVNALGFVVDDHFSVAEGKVENVQGFHCLEADVIPVHGQSQQITILYPERGAGRFELYLFFQFQRKAFFWIIQGSPAPNAARPFLRGI